MEDAARNLVRESAPWKTGQSWWVVGIEGIVALIIGVYIAADPVGARDAIRFLVSLVLLIVSGGQIGEAFRDAGQPAAVWAALRGGVGAAVAVLTLIFGWSDTVAAAGARQMLAIGLLAFGLLGIVALVFTFRSAGFRAAVLIGDLLAIVLGILLLSAEAGDTGSTRLLGLVAVVGGIALLAYSWLLRGKPAAR
jgi:uncharacterized membrane protein HdeD (DUF308 family)